MQSAELKNEARPRIVRAYVGHIDAGIAAVGFEEEDAARMAKLDELVRDCRCRVCNGRVRQFEDAKTRSTVCTACGGPVRQRQLELADAEKRQLLGLVGISTEEVMADEAGRQCAKCGKNLRPANRHDTCSVCRGVSVAGAANGNGGGMANSSSSARGDVRKNFRTLTAALGLNGEAMLDRFCAAWIENLKERARASSSDDSDDFRTPMERTG
jgi:hypothetical protein